MKAGSPLWMLEAVEAGRARAATTGLPASPPPMKVLPGPSLSCLVPPTLAHLLPAASMRAYMSLCGPDTERG